MKLAGVCLNTNKVRPLAEFYSQVLDARAEGDDTHMEILSQGAGLAVFSIEAMEAMAPHSTEGMGAGSVTLMFEVEGVDAEFERLQTLGVEMVKPLETHPWGARSFWFKDPLGNIVDLYEQRQK